MFAREIVDLWILKDDKTESNGLIENCCMPESSNVPPYCISNNSTCCGNTFCNENEECCGGCCCASVGLDAKHSMFQTNKLANQLTYRIPSVLSVSMPALDAVPRARLAPSLRFAMIMVQAIAPKLSFHSNSVAPKTFHSVETSLLSVWGVFPFPLCHRLGICLD